MQIAPDLILWYNKNRRDLPWRNTTDPYYIWLSEIILQQTRVAQGLSYYIRFVNAFPDIKSLASAKEDEVLKLWQGLGYYSRARNLHFTAKHIATNLNGIFPNNFKELQALKGVGKYTAAAIASFSFNEPVPVVDGNVCRVLSRLFEKNAPNGSSQKFNLFFSLAETLIDKNDPGTFNQAIMELGALVCKPANPSCRNCPIKKSCNAFQHNTIYLFPEKKQITTKNRYFNYLILRYKDKTYIKKRTTKDIWQNLYDFPLIESSEPLNINALQKSNEWTELFKNNFTNILRSTGTQKYKLTHQTLYVNFHQVEIQNPIANNDDLYIVTTVNELKKITVSRLIELYISEYLQ